MKLKKQSLGIIFLFFYQLLIAKEISITSWNLQTFFDGNTTGTEYSEFRKSKNWNVTTYEARLNKLPYMLVVGQQEEADRTVSVRSRFVGNEGTKALGDFINDICKEIRTKEIRVELPEEEKNK